MAQRFVGEIHEIPGQDNEPFIQWCLTLCGFQVGTPDEMPWCSAFANACCWLVRAPRTKSAMARSWLGIGRVVEITDAQPGYDVVILKRGHGQQPGPEHADAPGHVGFFAGFTQGRVSVLGGNQGDAVSVAAFPVSQILGIRRLKG